MNRLVLFIFTVILTANFCRSESSLPSDNESAEFSTLNEPVSAAQIIEQAIATMEAVATSATKLARKGILPLDETDKNYDEMIETLSDVTEMVKIPVNAYKFMKANGIERVIFPYMDISYPKLRERLLVLLQVLFETAPTTTDAVIPISAIDKLLDIFEFDDNLAMKAHVLDILYIWLPENPKAQIRVMKTKGLEPFYEQISKLDTSVIATLLDMFNTILEEHIKVRGEGQKSESDSDKHQLYQQIGLIERISTPVVCHGLMNIFENTWTYFTDDHEVIGPVLDLVKNMKPYCIDTLKGRAKPKKIMDALLDYVQDETKKEYLEGLNLNVTEITEVLQDYSDELKKGLKDEF